MRETKSHSCGREGRERCEGNSAGEWVREGGSLRMWSSGFGKLIDGGAGSLSQTTFDVTLDVVVDTT